MLEARLREPHNNQRLPFTCFLTEENYSLGYWYSFLRVSTFTCPCILFLTNNSSFMNIFFKISLLGAWIVVLFVGTGNAHKPAFPWEATQEFIAFTPSTPRLLWPLSLPLTSSTCTTSPQQVSIAMLLSHPASYHQRLVAVRGVVTQPELHLDDSELALRFVFRLAEGEQSIVIFGQHDRTQGSPSVSLDFSVEVIGVFWKERELNGSHVINTIEAHTVSPYPSLVPD